jgi:glycosyltransferase involved in cell wall biosynthesis
MYISHIGVGNVPVVYAYGGAIGRRIFELAKEQTHLGHRVVVYSVGEKTETQQVAGVEIRHIRCVSTHPWLQYEFQVRALADLRKDQCVEILHFHGQPAGAFLSGAFRAKKLLSYDYFYFGRGMKTPFYPLYKRLLERFDLLMPCSDYCMRESAIYWQLPANKIQVLYNGVNTHQFHPDAILGEVERKALGINKRTVLYVGRVCEQKGSDVLIKAFQLLIRKRHDVQLVIAGPIAKFGNMPTANPWIERIKQVGGLYLGAVEESRLSAIYNLADIFIMPTSEYEMFGMAAVEAQACGKPVIASDHGGLKETVPEKCGARFPIGDFEELAKKIEMLLDDHELYASCAEYAVQNASRFDWSHIYSRLDELYRLA